MAESPPERSTTLDQTAQMPFMITLAQKHRLRQLGHDEAAISAMTPQDAHRKLGLPT
jgi:hypothetical protein